MFQPPFTNSSYLCHWLTGLSTNSKLQILSINLSIELPKLVEEGPQRRICSFEGSQGLEPADYQRLTSPISFIIIISWLVRYSGHHTQISVGYWSRLGYSRRWAKKKLGIQSVYRIRLPLSRRPLHLPSPVPRHIDPLTPYILDRGGGHPVALFSRYHGFYLHIAFLKWD